VWPDEYVWIYLLKRRQEVSEGLIKPSSTRIDKKKDQGKMLV
jgi:hypothetical protein